MNKLNDVYKGKEIPHEVFKNVDTRVEYARAHCFKKLTASALDVHTRSMGVDNETKRILLSTKRR